jgi:hypothetical protein
VTVVEQGTLPTTTTLTVSVLSLGGNDSETKDVDDFKAVVTGSGSALTPAAGQVTFTLFDGTTVLTTFSGAASNPEECTFSSTLTFAPTTIDTLDSTTPDLCAGGVGGYVTLPGADLDAISVRANYSGGSGWAPSTSGPVNPETGGGTA